MPSDTTIIHFKMPQGLQNGFQRIILPDGYLGEGIVSKDVTSSTPEQQVDLIHLAHTDPHEFISVSTKLMQSGINRAIEDRQRRGLNLYGKVDGKVGHVTPDGKFIEHKPSEYKL